MKEKENKKKEVLQWIICILFVVLLVGFLQSFVFQRNSIDGDSMETTLQNGDSVLVEKVSYTFGDPKRFDVIVCYPFGKDGGEYIVKRVIGLPGETIQIINGEIYIDNEKLNENYGNASIDYEGIAEEPYKIKEGNYFVIGDNRVQDNSWDSRYEEIGTIDRKLIAGKVFLRIGPLNKIKFIKK